jgi:hypothetical protein
MPDPAEGHGALFQEEPLPRLMFRSGRIYKGKSLYLRRCSKEGFIEGLRILELGLREALADKAELKRRLIEREWID